MQIDPKAFRSALGHFGTGVAIVTTEVDGVKLGSTISSFNSVSLDPPLVLFSLIRNSLGFSQWKAARAFNIAILGESQQALSNQFAKAGTDKWQGLEPKAGVNGAPLIPGANAYFECEPYSYCDGGDHEIFVCRVTKFEISSKCEPALIFCAGRYQRLQTFQPPSLPPPDNLWLHGW